MYILTSRFCFYEFNLCIIVREKLYLKQLYERVVICSMFKGSVCRKGSEQGEGVRDDFLCSISSLFEVQ